MEETENIIEVQDVTMRFNLSEERTDTLKEYFIKLVSGRLPLVYYRCGDSGRDAVL